MKKLLLIVLLFVSFTSIAQETKTFEETLTPYVEQILQGIETGIDYAQQEIPIILKQYVIYEAIINWIYILFSFILLFITFKISKIFTIKIEEYENKYEDDHEGYIIGRIFVYIIGVVFFLTFFFMNIGDAIQATFFPKLFLVKEFLNYI